MAITGKSGFPRRTQLAKSTPTTQGVKNSTCAPPTLARHYRAFFMITLSDVSKSYGGRTLFSEASLQVNREDRIGIVGPNGAGKSTLFSLLLKNDEPDQGVVCIERGVTVGFLPQESAPVHDETVLELATAISPEFSTAQKSFRAAGETDHYDDIHRLFDELGGHHVESKAKKILKGLGFRDSDFDRKAKELSGGWVMRAHLARLLVQEPDLLLLDEPTNHLDLESLLWFQNYLTQYANAVLVISHDREFLNALVDSIIEIRFGKLIRYRGNFESYLEQRAANEANLVAAYKNQQREIARLMKFVDRFRAKNTKATQAQSKLKQIDRMEKIDAPASDDKEISFSFPQPQRSGLRVITLKDIHHAYGSNVVYRGMDFDCERGKRIVLVGPNGAGKSTLLKLLAGVLPVQSGERALGHNVKLGYYSQYRVEMLDPARTVLEEALDTPQRVTEQSIRTVLGCFLFSDDDVFKKVSVLSGGEKSRLALVKLLLDPPNLLLMDEPTTHLDMSSIDALIEALEQFEGTLIFISHDVYFIRALADHVIHVNAGRLTHYPGDYQYYLDKTAATSAREALTAGSAPESKAVPADRPSVKSKEQKRLEAEERQARSRVRREQQQIVHKIEKQIAELERRQAEITETLQQPETYGNSTLIVELNRELSGGVDQLQQLTSQWEVEASKLAEME
jgi:ATP-binding cassette subfamily F protein 3